MIKLFTTLALLVVSLSSNATVMYGSIGNFDVINDTGHDAHGFEIEYEGITSTQIGYSWDWSRYGVGQVVEVPANGATPAKVILRYIAKYDSATHLWSSTSNAATFPWMVTGAHQCTNPASTDGCEHFVNGAYTTANTNPPVTYHWLIESTPGVLVRADSTNSVLYPAPAINVPVFQPVVVQPNPAVPAVVEVVAVMPAPVEPLQAQWGVPHWVKVIKTTTHNANPVDIAKLINEDKNGDNIPDWQDGQAAQVESEWYLVQQQPDGKAAGAKGEHKGAVEKVGLNEKVTRKYEFYKYGGGILSFDGETHEAMCDAVAPGIPSGNPLIPDTFYGSQASVGVTDVNGVTQQYDCTADILVGDYIGANMVGFELVAPLAAIEMISDGQMGKAYVARSLVSGGNTPYTVTTTGMFPLGLVIDPATGILTGTPTESGVFTFIVDTTDTDAAHVSKAYTISITDVNGQMPVIPSPVISTQMLDNGVEDGLYQMQLLETSGTAPFVWTSTVLPTGLTLTDSGALTGTPAVGTAGITTPSITVTDKNGKSDTKVFTLNIAPAPIIVPVCTATETLINNVCVPDPICAANELLTNHVCVADPVCPVGSTITNHVCVVNPPVCAAPSTIVNGVCTAPVVSPGSCVKPAGAKSFVAHAKITAVGQGTITIGTKVVSIPTCATVAYKGHATTFGIGFDAEVKNGYTLNGINYGSSLIVDDGH